MPKFIVSMTRIGYATRDIEVEAANEAEAQEKAEDEAGNHEYSEHHADYECEGITEVQEEPLLPDGLLEKADDGLGLDLVHDLVRCEACGGLGWLIQNNDVHGVRVERCDACDVFPSDDAAGKHALMYLGPYHEMLKRLAGRGGHSDPIPREDAHQE